MNFMVIFSKYYNIIFLVFISEMFENYNKGLLQKICNKLKTKPLIKAKTNVCSDICNIYSDM